MHERVVTVESTVFDERAAGDESTEPTERAVIWRRAPLLLSEPSLREGTEKWERAAMLESTDPSERAEAVKSTDLTERVALAESADVSERAELQESTAVDELAV